MIIIFFSFFQHFETHTDFLLEDKLNLSRFLKLVSCYFKVWVSKHWKKEKIIYILIIFYPIELFFITSQIKDLQPMKIFEIRKMRI